MADPICPAGMVPQKSQGAVHPDEPAFCINKTEVPQAEFMKSLHETDRSAFIEVSNLLDGVFSEKVKGEKNPAVYVKWGEARAYCQARYPGGDLPTGRQWINACGSVKYCTPGGDLNHTEVIYDAWADGTADVDDSAAEKRVNERGVQDMTGNVAEWTRDSFGYDNRGVIENRGVIGGSWLCNVPQWLIAGRSAWMPSIHRDKSIGFRCIAPTLSPAEGSPEKK